MISTGALRILTDTVWYLDIGARALLCARLLMSRLWRFYPLFCLAMTLGVGRSIALAASHSLVFYDLTDPLLWLLSAGMCYEAFRKLTEHYPGIGSFGRVLASALFGVAMLIVAFTARVDDLSATEASFRIETTFQRYVITVCALFLLGAASFLSRLGRPWRRNRVHVTLMAILFSTQAIGYWFGNSSALGWAFRFWNIALQLISLACYLSWSVLLTVEGEQIPAVPRTMSDSEIAEALAGPDRIVEFIDGKRPELNRPA